MASKTKQRANLKQNCRHFEVRFKRGGQEKEPYCGNFQRGQASLLEGKDCSGCNHFQRGFTQNNRGSVQVFGKNGKLIAEA